MTIPTISMDFSKTYFIKHGKSQTKEKKFNQLGVNQEKDRAQGRVLN